MIYNNTYDEKKIVILKGLKLGSKGQLLETNGRIAFLALQQREKERSFGVYSKINPYLATLQKKKN
jgi:hypothetical protein